MTQMIRPSGRQYDQLRSVTLETGVAKHAEGSCLIKAGDPHVLCTASVETRVPPWLRNGGTGWVTAEYGMLPRSTSDRMRRESSAGKQSGRTQEIQRLIGRSLRAVTDLAALGENQISLDCDVLQADGGTRTASITGAFVALSQAVDWMKTKQIVDANAVVIRDHVAAISCGIYKDEPVLDLDYAEDSTAEIDANFILAAEGGIVEVQATGEERPFSRQELDTLLDLAEAGCAQLFEMQMAAVKSAV